MMSPNEHHLEIEVKFFLHDADVLRERLTALGAAGLSRVFESNRCYETAGEELKAQGQLLRLRHDDGWRLTFKSRPIQEDPRFKVFRELEVTLDDGRTMDAILVSLGFKAVQIYEKWRETYRWENVDLCIDSLPFGTFLEIEGGKTDIQFAARRLGFAWEKRILKNYLSIFDILRQEENLQFNDVTFANFEGRSATILPYLDRLYPIGTI